MKLRNGFLVDPGRRSRYFRYVSQQEEALVPIDEIDVPCAVLLGEPGIGKTTEVEALTQKIRDENRPYQRVLHVELGMITGYSALQGELLDAPEIKAWKQGEIDLTLVLDALDECSMARIGKHLNKQLFTDPHPANRLTLRIACRSSDWPESLNKSLRSFWDLDDLPVYHLAPLRRQDVIQAAEANSLDDNAFLETVLEADAGPFAASPLTLEALISRFKEVQDIPASKADLFEEYCLRLSTEENKDRKDDGETGILDPVQRVDLLSRIAALMVFGQRTRLCLEPSTSQIADTLGAPGSVLFADEARLDADTHSDGHSGPRLNEVKEAVRHSGLLRGSDDGRTFRWRHRSYAEYLAARFVHRSGLSIEQVRPLIEHEYDQTIAPPYQNVAVWLATLEHEMMEYLLDKDPSLVYAGDPLQYEDEKREELIEAILNGIDQGTLYTRINKRLNDLKRVPHSNLEQQLQRWIIDTEKSDDAREYAIQFARKQKLKGLVQDATDVALDAGADKYVRIYAIRLVDDLGDAADRKQLHPLAIEPGDEDADWRVVYEAREKLLPDLLSFAGLLDQIRADAEWEDPENVEGNWYHTFDQWTIHFTHRMDDGTLVEALQWALSNDEEEYFSKLREEIVQRSLGRVEVDEISQVLAGYIVEQMLQNQILPYLDSADFEDLRERNPEAHRDISREVIHRLANNEWEESKSLFVIGDLQSQSNLWRREDIDWLLDDLKETEEESLKQIYATVIQSFFHYIGFLNEEGFKKVYSVSQSSPILYEQTKKWIEPIELESEKAETLRNRFEPKKAETLQSREEKIWDWKRDPMDPPFREQLHDALDLCNDDITEGWKDLFYLLRRQSIEHEPAHYSDRDVTEFPAWRALSSREQKQVVDAGLKYLHHKEIARDDWLIEEDGHQHVTYDLIYGFTALWLIANHEGSSLSTIEPEVWERWGPAIFAYTPNTSEKRKEVHSKLADTAYRHAPEKCGEVLHALLTHFKYRKRDFAFLFDPIAEEDRIQDLLLNLQKSEDTPEWNRVWLSPYLLKRGIKEARSVAQDFARLSDDHQVFRDQKRQWLIRVLEADPSFGWDLIRDSFLSDDDYAKAMLYRMTQGGIKLLILPTSVLKPIIRRVYDLFPPRDDPPSKFGRTYSPSIRKKIQRLRKDLIRVLVNRGTKKAVDALENIASQFPDARKWGRTIHRAKKILRQKSMSSIPPSTLLALAEDASKRVIRSSAELQDVVLEALSDLQNRLNAQEQPAAADLWNEVPYGPRRDVVRDWIQSNNLENLREEVKEIKGTVFIPKEEKHLSDYVTRQLRQDLERRGITLTRESEVRVQNRTDILVKVPPTIRANGDLLSVIIEVKGSWNKDVLSSIQSQLADRYLDSEDTEYGTSRGIYLVVWFDLDRWNLESARFRRARRHESADKLLENMEDKVADLKENGLDTATRIKPFVLCV
ncbi:hypothetical protein CRI93_02575 [Longimonas halophila]|uniref:Uncharacterized protein n=2 Tax=Longimonas halophila TaxID=1469170 RepID=A0A2H3NXG9_9BACT|nr:hypothetical protein CRI93_02575 [Longimonas halophila]